MQRPAPLPQPASQAPGDLKGLASWKEIWNNMELGLRATGGELWLLGPQSPLKSGGRFSYTVHQTSQAGQGKPS